MNDPRILLVGQPQGLYSRLKQANYDVTLELNPAAALDRQNREWFHLSLVYLSQINGQVDPNALSFAFLASEPYLPKIIIYSEPMNEVNRMLCRALGNLENVAPAVAWISERDGLDAVLDAVQLSIGRHRKVNKRLDIRPNNHILYNIADCITEDSDAKQWIPELNHLFCMLFHDCSSVRLELLRRLHDPVVHVSTIWAQPMSLNIPQEYPVLIKCGPREMIEKIRDRFETYMFRVTGLRMAGYAQTTHFGAISYPALVDRITAYNQDFCDFYNNKVGTTANNDIGLAIDDFFTQATRLRYRISPPDDLKSKDLRAWYVKHLGLENETSVNAQLSNAINNAGIYGVRIEIKGDKLGVTFSTTAKPIWFPNPVRNLYRSSISALNAIPNLFRICFWDLRGSNMCVAKDNVVVLSGYEHLEWGPSAVDAVGLETLLKFYCLEHNYLFDLYKLEKHILSLSEFDEVPNVLGLDRSIQGMVDWLVHLRRKYARGLSNHELSYYLSNLFYFTMREFVAQDATPIQTLHALLSAAMICYRLEHWDNWIGWQDDLQIPI